MDALTRAGTKRRRRLTAEEKRALRWAFASRPDAQEALERAANEPHILSAECTEHGFKVAFQALTPGMLDTLLNTIEGMRKASGM